MDLSPTGMLTLGFPAVFSEEKNQQKGSIKFFFHSSRSQNGAYREKSVAFKCYYLANDSSHRMTVLKLIRHSKHPQKKRFFSAPALFLQLAHVFKHNFMPAFWQLIKQRPLGTHSAHLPAEIVTYLWCLQIAGCLLFYFTVSCLPNAYQCSEGDSFPHLCR